MKDGLEWVVEEDARRILLSSPPRAGCRIGIIGSERRHEAGRSGCSFPLHSLPVRDASRRRRSPETTENSTRPGARDVAFPSSRSQLGMRAGDDGHRRRRSDGTRPGARDVVFPSSRSQLGMRAGDDGHRRRRSDGTRPGARDVAFPSSRSQLGMRAGDDGHRRRRSDGTRPGAQDVAFPSSRSQLGMRAGDAEDETRGMDGTNHSGAF